MGWCVGYGTNIAWGAVRFTPTQDGQLESVDFWADDVNMQYKIKVFDTISGAPSYTFSSQLGTTQTGSTTEIGYYSIPLDTPIPLVSGDDFIVQVKLTTSSGWNYPIAIDYAQLGDWFYSDWHAVNSGESYTSGDGNTFSKYSYDIGIRARQSVEECRQCLGNCYSGSGCTGEPIATNVPCYECIGKSGDYWKPNNDDNCFNGEEPSDLCLNYCPQCCNGLDDDSDGKTDYPNDINCTCGLDPSEVAKLPPVPELPTILLFSIGLLMLAGYVIVRRRYS